MGGQSSDPMLVRGRQEAPVQHYQVSSCLTGGHRVSTVWKETHCGLSLRSVRKWRVEHVDMGAAEG